MVEGVIYSKIASAINTLLDVTNNKFTVCKFSMLLTCVRRRPDIMPLVPDRHDPTAPPPRPRLLVPRPAASDDGPVICERCGKAEMYRMHAVWRCPACGYKTDCCGW
jgi:hypothetical protein